jgi:SPP1 gp7 family putative phage head morphogenesis protein
MDTIALIDKYQDQVDKLIRELNDSHLDFMREVKREVYAFKSEYEDYEYEQSASNDEVMEIIALILLLRKTSEQDINSIKQDLYRSTHTDAMLKRIEIKLNHLAEKQEETLTNHLSKIYEYIVGNTNLLEKALLLRWSGQNYRENIWENKRRMYVKLKRAIRTGLIRKVPNREIDILVKKPIGRGLADSVTIYTTETTYMVNKAILDVFEEEGIKKYEYVAILDKRTSDICRRLDGQVFNVKDGEFGVNIPPTHFHCRSVIREYK